MAPRVLFVLAFTLAACGPDAPTPTGGGGTSTSGDPLPDTAMVREVSPETTLDFVAGDLTAASPSVAIQTLDLWIARLDTVSAEGVPELREDLTRLRNLLQSSPLDGRAIGRTLRDVGEQTHTIAESGTPLARLGRALESHGARLAPDSTSTNSAEAPAEATEGSTE